MFKISVAQLWVHDQDEALDFYTKKVGLEVQTDVTVAELGNARGKLPSLHRLNH